MLKLFGVLEERLLCSCECAKTLNHSGDNGEGDPPVLIPNTEVKPFSADGTWLDTTWESRTLPVPIKERAVIYCSFFYTYYLFTFHSSLKTTSHP